MDAKNQTFGDLDCCKFVASLKNEPEKKKFLSENKQTLSISLNSSWLNSLTKPLSVPGTN